MGLRAPRLGRVGQHRQHCDGRGVQLAHGHRGHDGAYHESTYPASAPSGYIHFKDSGSGLHFGDFVLYQGDVYRIAGGAPIYVANWATFGGVKPTITLSAAQWAGLRQYPVDGTLVAAQPSHQVSMIVGGAPLYVSDWATVGGVKPTVSIGDDDIRYAGAAVAGDADAPILLVDADSIPAVIAAESNRLRPGKVVVLGGENSVNSAILP